MANKKQKKCMRPSAKNAKPQRELQKVRSKVVYSLNLGARFSSSKLTLEARRAHTLEACIAGQHNLKDKLIIH